jgi:hypothetical protein
MGSGNWFHFFLRIILSELFCFSFIVFGLSGRGAPFNPGWFA